MKYKTNLKYKFIGFFSFFLIAIFLIWVFEGIYSRDQNGIETKGKVIEIFIVLETGRGFEYEYYVNGIKYSGSSKYDCNLPLSDSLTCKVIYEEGNPSNSQAYYNNRNSGCDLW